MSFSTTVKVRFSDVDPAGIAYYPTLINYLHVAFEEMFEGHVGVPYATVLGRDNLGFPAVSVNVEFARPFRFGEVITISVAVRQLGSSSIEFEYRLQAPPGEERARARVTVVCTALDTLKPRPVPDFYRDHFQRLLVAES